MRRRRGRHHDEPEPGGGRVRGALFLGLLLLAGCDMRPGAWTAIVYPDRTDRTKFMATPHFTMLSYCLESAKEQMEAVQVDGGGDYECGYNCGADGDPHHMNVCEEVRK
jgi:hypothetical protein